VIALAALLLAAQVEPSEELRARVETQPRAVQAFIERRALCNHFMGEDAYDAERGRQIARALRRLRCGAIEADEAALRWRHADSAETQALLDETRDLLGW